MKYRLNLADDKTAVTLALNLGQVRLLEELVHADLMDVYVPDTIDQTRAKALERLADRLYEVTHVRLSADEEKAEFEAARARNLKAEAAYVDALMSGGQS